MFVRSLAFFAALALIFAPAPVRADDAKAFSPTLIIRISSIDSLEADAKYLANLAGKAEAVGMFDAFKGPLAAAIDTKRPLGGYGIVGPNGIDSTVVVLVPVADEKAFLALAKTFGQEPEKGADGVYSVSPDNVPVPIYARFAHKYAYITAQDKSNIDKEKLLLPDKVLGGHIGAASVVFRIDRIPDEIKELAIGQLELQLANAKDQKTPGESDAQHKIKGQVLDESSKRLVQVLKEGGELAFSVNIDRKAGKITTEASFGGKSGSELAAGIASLGQSQSLFASILSPDAAVGSLVHVTLPQSLRKLLDPVLNEGITKALENEKDENKRKQATAFFKAIEPTLKSGELDAGFALHGPDKGNLYTFVAGIKIKNGTSIETQIRDLLKSLPEKDQSKIKLDADSAGAVKIHRIEAQESFDENAKQMFGNNPILVAIRDDAVLLSGGPDALSAIKKAVAAEAKTAPQFAFNINLARVAPLMAKGEKAASKAAEHAFKGKKGSDKIHVTLTGGDAIKAQFSMDAGVVKFFAYIAEHGAKSVDTFKSVEPTIKKKKK